ncbi:hypothetical protein B0H34DRAFT_442564 [Crassisporium funariophilum]|nr:hypothetical protein B0H34DRAFT_442564 [Crassisporium funariophilum]
MDSLRRRIPFKLGDDVQDGSDGDVLDEQQQDGLVQELRKENGIANRRYLLAVRAVVGLSSLLQLLTANNNPLLAIYPSTEPNPSIPLPVLFTLLSLFIHVNLALSFFSDEIRVLCRYSSNPKPLSYQLLYSLSAVAPTMSLFLQKPLQTFLWWSVTPSIVFIAQTVADTMEAGTRGIAELETMKYTAPGA